MTYRFSHDFYRETVYEETVAPERINIHKQVAQALEEIYATNREEHAVELTEHFSHSSNPFDLAKAVTYGEIAAKRAEQVYAHGEAVRLWEHIIRVQEVLDAGDKAKCCDLLLSLNEALLNEGNVRRILDYEAPRVWALCEIINDPARSARICYIAMLALFYYQTNVAWASPDAALWAERAKKVAHPNTVANARSEIALGVVKCANWYLGEGVAILNRAIQSARNLGDVDTYWWAVTMWMLWASGFNHDEELLNLADDLSKRPRNGVSMGVLVWALILICDTLLDNAKRLRAEETWNELKSLIQRNGGTRYQIFLMLGDTLFATINGDLDEAVNILNQTKKYAGEMGFTEFASAPILHTGLRPLIYLGLAEQVNNLPLYVSSEAEILFKAHFGQPAEATKLVDERLAWYVSRAGDIQGEEAIYNDILLLEAAVIVENYRAVEFLFHRFDKCKSYTTGMFDVTCIDRHLGAAAYLMGRPDEASVYLRRALEVSSGMKFRPEIALTRLQMAELILAHYPVEKGQAISHLDFVIKEFREMKMEPSLTKALKLKNDSGS